MLADFFEKLTFASNSEVSCKEIAGRCWHGARKKLAKCWQAVEKLLADLLASAGIRSWQRQVAKQKKEA